MDSLPEDGQFVIVEDSHGRDAVARWSHKFAAWFGPDGDPIVIRPTRWRPMPAESSPKSLPEEGQLVIVEDAAGDKAVARWSSEIEAWFGANGNPIGIRPVNWQPIPADDAPPPRAPPPASKAVVLENDSAEAFRESEFVFDNNTFDTLQLKESADADEELNDNEPTPVRSLSTRSTVAPPRRSLPILSVALVSIVISAVLMVIVSGGDPAREFRALLAWLENVGPTPAASQPPVDQRDPADGQQASRPANADTLLKAAMEDAASRHEARRPAEDRPDESASQQTVPAQKSENAEPVAREGVVTSDATAARRNPEEGASGTKLARAIDDPPAIGDKPASPKPAEGADVSRLLERASALLKQGDIGAARMVLAFANDSGSARAAFMLAETYDPQVLSALKVLGTSSDIRKARELYAKAYAGGIEEARARFNALSK
jgi:hypothetical protein